MKALVLSGGDDGGAYEAGAIESLGPGFDIVCGASIGAIFKKGRIKHL